MTKTIADRCRIIVKNEGLPKKLITSVEETRRFLKGRKDYRYPVAMVTMRRFDMVDPKTREYIDVAIHAVPLYNIGDLDAAQLLTVGTAPECDLRPFTEPLKKPHDRKTAKEVIADLHSSNVATDTEVTDLHAVIYLDKDSNLVYLDRSVLGSVVNDEIKVMGTRYHWSDYIFDNIGIGEQKIIKVREKPNAKLEKTRLVTIERKQSRFKMHWVPYDMFPQPKRKGLL